MSSDFSCIPCGKTMTGPESYLAHVSSQKHLKKSEEYNRIKSGTLSGAKEYYCETCKKECSGPVPFNEHMNSEAHEKQRKKNKLMREVEEKQQQSPDSSPRPGHTNSPSPRSLEGATFDPATIRRLLKCPLCTDGDLMCLKCNIVIRPHPPLSEENAQSERNADGAYLRRENIAPSAPPEDIGEAKLPDEPPKLLNLYPNLQSFECKDVHDPIVCVDAMAAGGGDRLACNACGIEKFRDKKAMDEHLLIHSMKASMNLNNLS